MEAGHLPCRACSQHLADRRDSSAAPSTDLGLRLSEMTEQQARDDNGENKDSCDVINETAR